MCMEGYAQWLTELYEGENQATIFIEHSRHEVILAMPAVPAILTLIIFVWSFVIILTQFSS